MKKLLLILALVITCGIYAHTQQVPDFQYNPMYGGGGGGGSQTPWTSNIDGGGFDLTGVGEYSQEKDATTTKEPYMYWTDNGVTNGLALKILDQTNGTSWQFGYYTDASASGSGGGTNPQGGFQFTEDQVAVFVNSGQGYTWTTTAYYPANNTYELGQTGNRWEKLWADSAELTNGLTVGDTISGSWDLPDGEDLLKIVDDTSGDGLFIESESADGAAFSIGLTQDDGVSYAPRFYFWSGGIIFRPSGVLNSTYLSGADISLRESGQFKFSANNDATASADTGLCRNAAGVAMISDGSGCVAGTDEADLLVDEISLADQGTKGTCDSGKAGTIAYEVVTNVGTFYGCRQTAASTYAWTALH